MTVSAEDDDRSRVFAQQRGVVLRHIADETLLVPTTGELANLQRIFVLDPVGELVWDQLDGKRDVASVVHSVTEEFDVSADRAETDINEFIAALNEAGLVVEQTPKTAADPDDPSVSPDHR